ncbi:ABC transporter ATP-binding protein [Geofilum rubicundum]|uniref:Ferric iron ABC transporter, ATP-binding protein n=1 Tax=Geofilum rubicundum JCM 15548 TaxID=1236989 RepID=A0A0E9LWP3_9BACT|nr:ABC transporter ATP-binding protein [Geofilum rubicundum]GAO29982.1 ferric iron ABC transporter, ATP-binding protein [Geofilum rubicundum JCM 15548]
MTILSARHISKTYPGSRFPALSQFSLDIQAGEIVGLLGESGCGKTTALRILAGFETADHGTLTIQNKIAFNNKQFTDPTQRDIGIIFQDYALFPHLTVWKNITFGLNKKSGKNQRKLASEMMDLVGLAGYDNRYPHQLSGGQQQRVALARAMAPRPKILLMDEPFSNIDTVKKNQIRQELHSLLKKTGSTVIFVTHDTRDVMAMADQVIVMKEGQVLQQGTPQAVFKSPRNAYLAGFFGNTNFIEGRMVNGQIRTDLGPLAMDAPVGLTEDQPVLFSLRPGDISLTNEKDGQSIPVQIERQRFMGEFTEVECRLVASGTRLLFHVPPNQPVPNKTTYIQISEKDLHLLPESPTHGHPRLKD